MFIIKENINIDFRGKSKAEIARLIGIAPETLYRVLKKKQACSKIIAYCITKLNDENAEILDYFDYLK